MKFSPIWFVGWFKMDDCRVIESKAMSCHRTEQEAYDKIVNLKQSNILKQSEHLTVWAPFGDCE